MADDRVLSRNDVILSLTAEFWGDFTQEATFQVTRTP